MDFLKNYILFPTDFSKNAEHALPFAAEIASQTGGSLMLYHASQDTMDLSPNFEMSKDETIQDANTHFDQLISALRKKSRYKSLKISTILQSGHPVTSLLNHIKEDTPGLIVMGTKGATSNRNAVFGSVATNLIQKSEVPVLAIPQGSTNNKFKNIVFMTDYKENDLSALAKTVDFARLFNSTVDVLHIASQKNIESEIKFRGFRELVTSQISYGKLNFHLEYENDFFSGAASYLIDHPTSLLVMIRYKKTFWEKLGERDHSKEMAFYSDVPLLILPGDQTVHHTTTTLPADNEQHHMKK